MSTFKYSKGKLVEQPDETRVPKWKGKTYMGQPYITGEAQYEAYQEELKEYTEYKKTLRTYIAEGFAEDELVEERDLELRLQKLKIGAINTYWIDCGNTEPKSVSYTYRQIARRKITKEEGEKPDCSQHKRDLFGESDMKKVAEAIGDLHYETLADFLYMLSQKFHKDAMKDAANGRKELTRRLLDAALSCHDVHVYIHQAWQISKPFMKSNNLT